MSNFSHCKMHLNVTFSAIPVCYAENAICCIDNVMTTFKGFQGRSRIIANIILDVLSAHVCATGRDWLESVALLLSERDRVDVMALGGAKISMM